MCVWFVVICIFFFKQKTAYEMRISDWSADVCSSDLIAEPVDRARRRCHRNPRLAGYVPQCRHTAGPLSLIWRGAAPATPFLFRRARKRQQRNRLQWRNARSFPHCLQRFAVGAEQVQMSGIERSCDHVAFLEAAVIAQLARGGLAAVTPDRKSTRLNSSP